MKFEHIVSIIVPTIILIATLAVVIADTKNNTEKIKHYEKTMMTREVIELKIKQTCDKK